MWTRFSYHSIRRRHYTGFGSMKKQVFFLKIILNSFAESTSLHVNYHKSNIYPINVPAQGMKILARTFQCQIGTLPFTYLGLPMGLTRIPGGFLPLVQKIEKQLSSTTLFLSQAGRLQMVNSMFSSLPTYYMCALRLPKSIINQIDKYRKHYLLRGLTTTQKNRPRLLRP